MSGANRELSSTEMSIFLAAAWAATLSRTADSALRPISKTGRDAWDMENDTGRTQSRPPDFEGMARQQAETDETWRAASAGFMELEKITYRSSLGDFDIPAFVFQPLKERGASDEHGE